MRKDLNSGGKNLSRDTREGREDSDWTMGEYGGGEKQGQILKVEETEDLLMDRV